MQTHLKKKTYFESVLHESSIASVAHGAHQQIHYSAAVRDHRHAAKLATTAGFQMVAFYKSELKIFSFTNANNMSHATPPSFSFMGF